MATLALAYRDIVVLVLVAGLVSQGLVYQDFRDTLGNLYRDLVGTQDQVYRDTLEVALVVGQALVDQVSQAILALVYQA